MKVLFINSFYRPQIGGGAELILETIVEGFAKRGHEVAVLSTAENGRLTTEWVGSAKVYRAGVANYYWHFTDDLPNKFIRAAWHWRDIDNHAMEAAVKTVIDLEKPDVISFHNLRGFSISAWRAATISNVPTIQVLHDYYLMCPTTQAFKNSKRCQTQCLECRLYRRRHKSQSRKISTVIGVSQFILDRFTQNGYFEGASRLVIYNAQDIPDSGLPPRPQRDDVVFGFIGSLTPPKGLEWLLREFNRTGEGATLLIAGRGSSAYTDALKAIAEGRDVKFLGYTDSKDFYKNIDVLIVPSVWPEPFCGVVYEACAQHVPIIAARSGGLPEVVRDGLNGLLCDPLRPETLGDCIARLRENRGLILELSSRARQSVTKFTNVKRMIDAHEQACAATISKI